MVHDASRVWVESSASARGKFSTIVGVLVVCSNKDIVASVDELHDLFAAYSAAHVCMSLGEASTADQILERAYLQHGERR